MLLSIIIPVYNLEKYIGECLDSCLKQDIDDYEIICVNDGSKDGSGAIFDKCVEMYSNKIKAYHKENGIIYKDIDFLYDKIKHLFDNPKKRKQMSLKAYDTIVNGWNAENTVEKFLKLSECILNGEKNPEPFKSGFAVKQSA